MEKMREFRVSFLSRFEVIIIQSFGYVLGNNGFERFFGHNYPPVVISPGVFGDLGLPFRSKQFYQVLVPPGSDKQKGLVLPVPNHRNETIQCKQPHIS